MLREAVRIKGEKGWMRRGKKREKGSTGAGEIHEDWPFLYKFVPRVGQSWCQLFRRRDLSWPLCLLWTFSTISDNRNRRWGELHRKSLWESRRPHRMECESCWRLFPPVVLQPYFHPSVAGLDPCLDSWGVVAWVWEILFWMLILSMMAFGWEVRRMGWMVERAVLDIYRRQPW